MALGRAVFHERNRRREQDFSCGAARDFRGAERRDDIHDRARGDDAEIISPRV